MNGALRVYRFLNIISLDVAVGAVVCALFFARVLDVTIKIYGLFSLGLTVWIIYTADHLLDARRLKQAASTERHRFHQRNFKILSVALLAAMVAVGVLIFFIRRPVFIGGLLLSSVVVIYLVIQRYLKFTKEILGAILYCGGVMLAPISLMDKTPSWMQILLVVQFVITALTNLILFSWIDVEDDLQDKHHSFTTIFGEKSASRMLTFLFTVNMLLSALHFLNTSLIHYVAIIVVMNIVLLMIFINRTYFSVNDRYRLLGDAVFLFPAIYLIF